MVDREDPAASTAMFRAFVQRREVDSPGEKKTVGVGVWIVAALAVVVVIAVLVAILA